MKNDLAAIELEYRYEVQAILDVIEKYVDAYPKERNNKILKQLYNLLDIIDMTW